jgi:predicted enzyme related to lactoylglutathione lyase
MARLDYVELPASNLPAMRSFYEQLFGWSPTAFGLSYAKTVSGDTDVGTSPRAIWGINRR